MSQSEPFDDRDGVRGLRACTIDPGVIHRWEVLADDVSKADVVVGSRMHALYLGMFRGARLVAVGSKPKVKAFAGEFGIPVAASLADVSRVQPALADERALRLARERAQVALTSMVAAMAS